MNELSDISIQPAEPPGCDWPVTNCYIDVWMLLLRSWGLQPAAGLGVTATQDYEGDQFTFFKYLHEDLERLYGLLVGELSIYSSVEQQTQEQMRLGRLVLVEVDGYYLPDTRATSYRTQHTKTTIGVDEIDPAAGRLTYFHNVGHYELSGEDYAGAFRKLPQQQEVEDVLPPYVEFVKRRWPPLLGRELTDAAVALLRRHLRRRPESNPIAAYRADFARHMDWLMAHPNLFHEYAFGIFRQLGANWQLLGQHLQWLHGQQGVPACHPSSKPPRPCPPPPRRCSSRWRASPAAGASIPATPCSTRWSGPGRRRCRVWTAASPEVRSQPAQGGRMASIRSCTAAMVQPVAEIWDCARTEAGSVASPDRLPPLDWFPAVVPGTFAAALRAAGRWNGEPPLELDGCDIWYRTRFAGGGQEVLRFEGLATIAEVWLNGELLFRSDSMFLPQQCSGAHPNGQHAAHLLPQPDRVAGHAARPGTLASAAGLADEPAVRAHHAAGSHARLVPGRASGRPVASHPARAALRSRGAGRGRAHRGV